MTGGERTDASTCLDEVPYRAGVIAFTRLSFVVALALIGALGCRVETEPPAGVGNRGAGGASGAGGSGGGQGAVGGTNAGGLGGASGGGRGGSAGAGADSGATAGTAGSDTEGGAAGDSGTAGSGGAAGDAAGDAGGAGGDAEGGHSAGTAGAGGAQDSSCANPITTVDTTNLAVEETVETYTVTGSTDTEIRQSINENRDGDYDAFTSWYLSWSYSNNACDGSGLVVLVELAYSLPEWDEPDAADPVLVDEWNAYMDALHCHEYGHARFGLDAANEVYEALSAIDAGGDCGAQQAQADAAFQGILNDYIAREITYDDETNHGATMGAIFPLP